MSSTLTPEAKSRAYRLFDQALALPSGQRKDFLDGECGGDALLRAEVDTLLAIATSGAASTGSLDFPVPPVIEDLSGQHFGRFHLEELVGAGGMGSVYRASRTEGVEQLVAVKVLPAELTRGAYPTFEREAQMLARLEHPAIARFIDSGSRDGRAWIAIEFVRGEPIDRWCDAHQVGLRERIRMLILLAQAVADAHRVLIVHRDIKPGNVLVTAEGLPKLIDFGIAATLVSGALPSQQATIELRRFFTPGYAAPEQVLGQHATVATDVFGLGALAYRLLTDCVPHADSTSAISYSIAVLQTDLQAPSRVAASPARARELRGDLDAILLKALARDPTARYAGAADFGADLQRYLDRQPVLARRSSNWYRLGRFVRRHRVAVGTGAVAFAALAIAIVLYAMQAERVRIATAMAARRGEFLEKLLNSADPRAGRRDITVAELLDKAASQSDTELAAEPRVAASLLSVLATTNNGLGRFDAALQASTRQLNLLRQHGGTNAEIADALDNQGDALNRLGRRPEAEQALRQAVGLLGGRCDSEGVLPQTLDLLAIVLTNSKQEAEAEADYRSSIACYATLAPAVAAMASYPLNNLQILLANEGKYAESMTVSAQALELMRKLRGPDHPDTLSAELNYAESMVNDQRIAAAVPLLRQVLDGRTRQLGAEHPDTLHAVSSLADALNEEHQYAEAASLELPAARSFDKVLGSEHPLSLYAWSIYGLAACRTADQQAGMDALQRVLAGRQKQYGAEDWRTQSTAVTLGGCLIQMKRYEEARPGLLHAAQVLEKERGPDFLRTQAAYQALATLFNALGDTAAAKQWQARLSGGQKPP